MLIWSVHRISLRLPYSFDVASQRVKNVFELTQWPLTGPPPPPPPLPPRGVQQFLHSRLTKRGTQFTDLFLFSVFQAGTETYFLPQSSDKNFTTFALRVVMVCGCCRQEKKIPEAKAPIYWFTARS
jgi:hypothetical protein